MQKKSVDILDLCGGEGVGIDEGFGLRYSWSKIPSCSKLHNLLAPFNNNKISSYSIIYSIKMSEKLYLQWNDFLDNVKKTFGHLRENNDFSDVTLACEDGQQVEAHKVILAASSPFFQKLLQRNKHPHPLIYMRGMKSEDLLAIVEFLYSGEASIFQENLDSFLAIAEELEMKGLRRDEKVHAFEVEKKPQPPAPLPDFNTDTNSIQRTPKNKIHGAEENGGLAVHENFSGDLEELEERVKSMMEKSQNKVDNGLKYAYICKVCGKEGEGGNIKDHINSNHLKGIVVHCNICNKASKSRRGLRHHKRQYHN